MRRDAGAYSATRGPLRAPGDPRGPPREPCGSQGPHGPGGCLSAPACGDFGPGPRFGIRHSPAVPHGQDRRGTPYSPVETVATHGIAAARATAGGRQGLLDLHPQRALIQAPTAATSGVGSKRPVGGRRHAHHDTARDAGDKSDHGKSSFVIPAPRGPEGRLAELGRDPCTARQTLRRWRGRVLARARAIGEVAGSRPSPARSLRSRSAPG